jgi:acetoin utilization deacetylase AcuC-like enzyme
VDVHLSDGVGDEEYLERLSAAYRFPIHGFHPQLLVYVAGADPYREDQLGGLSLTLEGLMQRDRLVIETALREGTAVVIVLAGGYAINLQDTVTIHSNTAKVAKEALDAVGWSR